MQNVHLDEAILLVNRRIHGWLRGVGGLDGLKDSGLTPAYFDEELTLFRVHTALRNACCCSHGEVSERRNDGRSGEKYREHEKYMLDQAQAHEDVLAMQDSRRLKAKALGVHSLGSKVGQTWERQYRKSPIDVGNQTQHRKGELR